MDIEYQKQSYDAKIGTLVSPILTAYHHFLTKYTSLIYRIHVCCLVKSCWTGI